MNRTLSMVFLAPGLAGCAAAPSVNVLGAYFPDWMFCTLSAILLTTAIHAALRSTGRLANAEGLTLPLAYAALIAIFALAGWLILFKN